MSIYMVINFVMAVLKASAVMCDKWITAHPIGFLTGMFVALVIFKFTLEGLEEYTKIR